MAEDGESQRQFAKRVGLSQTRVNQLIREGLPTLPNGRIDTGPALTWLEQNLDPQRRARAKGQLAEPVTITPTTRAPEPAAEKTSAPAPEPGGGPAQATSLAEARRQHEIVRVGRARLKFETERGRLVSRDIVKTTVFTRARRERSAHLSWVLRTAPLMAAELGVDPTAMFVCLDRHMRDHLQDLSRVSLLDLPEG